MESRIILSGTDEQMNSIFEDAKNISVRFYEKRGKSFFIIIRHNEDIKKRILLLNTIKGLIKLDSELSDG